MPKQFDNPKKVFISLTFIFVFTHKKVKMVRCSVSQFTEKWPVLNSKVTHTFRSSSRPVLFTSRNHKMHPTPDQLSWKLCSVDGPFWSWLWSWLPSRVSSCGLWYVQHKFTFKWTFCQSLLILQKISKTF